MPVTVNKISLKVYVHNSLINKTAAQATKENTVYFCFKNRPLVAKNGPTRVDLKKDNYFTQPKFEPK